MDGEKLRNLSGIYRVVQEGENELEVWRMCHSERHGWREQTAFGMTL